MTWAVCTGHAIVRKRRPILAARGEGSGIPKTNAPEIKGQERAAAREAKLHKEPKLQGAPK